MTNYQKKLLHYFVIYSRMYKQIEKLINYPTIIANLSKGKDAKPWV
jgi:hypothetical protein